MQLLLLGLLAFGIGMVSDSTWAMVAGRQLRSWFVRKPRRGEAMDAVGGASMICLGVGLALAATRAENICWLRAAHPYSDLVTKQLSRALASHDVARENGDACLRRTLRTPYDI